MNYESHNFHAPINVILPIYIRLPASSDLNNFQQKIKIICLFVSDENRELNGHPDDEIKRQRTQYNGDQLYSNVSVPIKNYLTTIDK